MTGWDDFGFTQSPYAVKPIEASEEGMKLLVGRDAELNRLVNQLKSSSLHSTIEGDNGVGKTSLISVAAFYAHSQTARERNFGLFPVGKVFQLSEGESSNSFEQRVYRQIARSFIDRRDELSDYGYTVPRVSEVERWLTDPILTSWSGGASAFGVGGTIGRGQSANPSAGFADSGFTATVQEWLEQCFPWDGHAFVCVLDNLELLRESQSARTMLETIRDTVLSQRGLKWVICGARGIVRGTVSSQRLQGLLASPIEVKPLLTDFAPEVVSRRIGLYSESWSRNQVAPVGPSSFKHLYEVLHHDLRGSLAAAENFCLELQDQDLYLSDQRTNDQHFITWIAYEADKQLAQTSHLSERSWKLFDDLAYMGGSCHIDEFLTYDFSDPIPMQRAISELHGAQLTDDAIIGESGAAVSAKLTTKGWLVRYSRSAYHLPDR